MQIKAELSKKPETPSSGANKSKQNKPEIKRPTIRTTDIRKLMDMILNNPDSITHEEFMLFQKQIGYREAMALMQEGKRHKREKGGEKQESKSSSEVSNNEKPIQLEKEDTKEIASQEAKIGLPYQLKSGLEKLSSIDLSDVKVHQNSDKPQRVSALAYTQGNDIHIAPGQEKHLPHEGWHAVQQKQGRVKPSLQMKAGTLVNDDASLEKEADIMGSKAIQVGSQSNTLQLKESSKTNLGENQGNVIQKVTKKKDSYETNITVLYKGDKYITLYSDDKFGIDEKEKEINKINKKEKRIAMESAIAATASKKILEKKYPGISISHDLPIVIDATLLEQGKKAVKVLSEVIGMEIKREKKIRAGKGKRRGRKYKKSAKLLLIVSSKENAKKMENFGLDVIQVKNLNIFALAPGGVAGRLAIWTPRALEELK
ncbi:MAG: 50S ribosomal protein L4 [Candidatus Pacearchaeota archaeon]|nr:50S ribosomal protein L4 [Candidatus Pacearchaeota archaeon]